MLGHCRMLSLGHMTRHRALCCLSFLGSLRRYSKQSRCIVAHSHLSETLFVHYLRFEDVLIIFSPIFQLVFSLLFCQILVGLRWGAYLSLCPFMIRLLFV